MEILINEPEKIKPTLYQKQKESIYKWREANKEIYLIKQHQYFKKKMEDPEKKQKHLQQVKDNYYKKKDEEAQKGIIKKRGRPTKYID